MAIATISLLIANLVTVVSVGVYLGKELDKTNKQLEKTEAVLYTHMSKTAEGIGYDIAGMEKGIEEKLEMKEIKGELKEHISKEFMAMAFRGIKITDFRK